MSAAARRQACNDTIGVDKGQLDRLLGYAIARANFVGDATFHAAVRDRSVTPLRYAMLEVVGSNPGLLQVQLGETLALSRPTVTMLLDYWQSQDCIERRSTPIDRRSFGIFLTAIGSARLAELRACARVHDRELSLGLTASERAELKRLLDKLARTAN